MKQTLLWLMDQHDPSKAEGSYDAGKIPTVMMNLGGKLMLYVADPAIVQDMLVTKNAQIDKTGVFENFFKNLFGNSFLFSKSNDIWKKKRQATSHAFYKDRLEHMLTIVKEQVLKTQDRWLSEIESSYDGYT